MIGYLIIPLLWLFLTFVLVHSLSVWEKAFSSLLVRNAGYLFYGKCKFRTAAFRSTSTRASNRSACLKPLVSFIQRGKSVLLQSLRQDYGRAVYSIRFLLLNVLQVEFQRSRGIRGQLPF
jgi:hypothetical protein